VLTRSGGRVAIAGRSASSRLPADARQIGKRLFVRDAGRRARFVYVVRNGRVRFAGVGTRAATRNRAALRRYLRLARVTK
jgi:hypothetical protein